MKPRRLVLWLEPYLILHAHDADGLKKTLDVVMGASASNSPAVLALALTRFALILAG
jgi:hypothetical protein